MPSVNRHHCTRCGGGIHEMDAPVVVQITVGQPEDTGPALDVNGAGVRLPSFVREIMKTTLPRVELCVECAAAVLGVPLVTVEEDPMTDALLMGVAQGNVVGDAIPATERAKITHVRTLEAIRIGRGDKKAPVLVPHVKDPKPHPGPPPRPRAEARLVGEIADPPRQSPPEPRVIGVVQAER